MKKIILALALIASNAIFISCSADSITEENSEMIQQAGDTGGNGTPGQTIPPPPPPPIPPIR